MSKYKLVPVEPTDEMGIAGCEAVTEMPNNTWLDHYEAVTCFKAMLAAAPAVQGEPVAYAVFADNGNIRIWSADPIQAETLIQEYGDQVRPLYTAQPPAPQPATEVRGEPVGWVWHSYNQTNFTSGSHHKEVLETDGVKLTPVYTTPQPATEAALLEAFVAQTAAQAAAAELAAALDGMIKEADLASWGGYFPATAVTRAVEALAAFRKGGDV